MPDKIIECSTHGTRQYEFESVECPYCQQIYDCWADEEATANDIAYVTCEYCRKDFEIHCHGGLEC